VAVALGNAPPSPEVMAALESRADEPSALVREHVQWALAEQYRRLRERDDGGARAHVNSGRSA
jgi:epoxyqueuosine reductase